MSTGPKTEKGLSKASAKNVGKLNENLALDFSGDLRTTEPKKQPLGNDFLTAFSSSPSNAVRLNDLNLNRLIDGIGQGTGIIVELAARPCRHDSKHPQQPLHP